MTRPDIFKLVDGQKKVGRATYDPWYYDCDMEYVNIDEAVENVSTYVESFFDGFNNRTYLYKEPVTINEKECDVYYDDDVDVEGMIVCDEFIYRIYNFSDYYYTFNVTFNFTWGEPEMEDFTFSYTSGCDSRVGTTPSRKYAHCSLTSSSSGSLGAYTYLQPSYPCAFELKITSSDSNPKYYKFDGNFIYYSTRDRYGDDLIAISRPDIRQVENGTEEMAVFLVDESSYNTCSMNYLPIKDVVDSMHKQVWSLTDGFNNRTYYHKESVIINKRHYDLYYDEEKEDEVVYVHRGYIYKVQVGNSFVNFDYTWFQPSTSEFALDKSNFPSCASKDQRIYSTPSRDYANCVVPEPPSLGSLDSSVRTEAMIFAVIAVIATSLVALF